VAGGDETLQIGASQLIWGFVVISTKSRETNSASLLADEMLPRVYGELRRMAAQCMRHDRPGHTLRPTALVHEAYLRLARGNGSLKCESTAHFVNIVVRLMRQILVEYGRRRCASRHGSGLPPLPLLDAVLQCRDASRQTLALNEALEALGEVDPRKCVIVEYRHFGGFTTEEIAGLTRLSARTVEREMKLAYAWLSRWVTEGRPA
jgi:RNA polymerase sigma factor (TIGR02999 family)